MARVVDMVVKPTNLGIVLAQLKMRRA